MGVSRFPSDGRRGAAALILPLLFVLPAFPAFPETSSSALQITDDFAAMSWTGGKEKGSSAAAMYAGAETLYCMTGRDRVKRLCAGDSVNDDLRERISSFGFPAAKDGASA